MSNEQPSNQSTTTLKRELSLLSISFYGIGTIIGAGIYVLIGKVAAASGILLPFAFLLAGTIAAFTAFTYAELSSRYPFSAGSAVYVFEAWKSGKLSQLVGIFVVITGIVSAATITRGFVGYMNLFVSISPQLCMALLICLLTAIAAWGIKESAITVTLITLVEIGGLLYVLVVGSSAPSIGTWDSLFESMIEPAALLSVVTGGFLAFYAFIGFEDMVNIAEEIKNPRKTLPRAIIIAIVVSTLIYVSIAFLAIRTTPVELLQQSGAPLADIVARAGYSTQFIGVISLIAVVNGALVQIIMASRLLYGLSNKGLAPKWLSRIHHKTQTPINATLLVAAMILIFALWLPLTLLAKITSFIMLLIFSLINLSLVTIKLKDKALGDATPKQAFVQVPIAIPIAGCALSLSLLTAQLLQ